MVIRYRRILHVAKVIFLKKKKKSITFLFNIKQNYFDYPITLHKIQKFELCVTLHHPTSNPHVA